MLGEAVGSAALLSLSLGRVVGAYDGPRQPVRVVGTLVGRWVGVCVAAQRRHGEQKVPWSQSELTRQRLPTPPPLDGVVEGVTVGTEVGATLGAALGAPLEAEGVVVGAVVGAAVCAVVGAPVGAAVCVLVGAAVVGSRRSGVGAAVGATVGEDGWEGDSSSGLDVAA